VGPERRDGGGGCGIDAQGETGVARSRGAARPGRAYAHRCADHRAIRTSLAAHGVLGVATRKATPQLSMPSPPKLPIGESRLIYFAPTRKSQAFVSWKTGRLGRLRPKAIPCV